MSADVTEVRLGWMAKHLRAVIEAGMLVARWTSHDPRCAFKACNCASVDLLPDALVQFHRRRLAAERALSSVEVKAEVEVGDDNILESQEGR